MACRGGFALLLLTLAIFPSRYALSQETTAAEGSAKFSRTHCEVPSCVQKVLYFSNIAQPGDLQDVVNALRVIAEIQRVQQIIGAHVLVIEGTAEQVAMAEKLAAEFDRDFRRFGGLGYRIELKIQESEGDKRLHSRLYSFVTDARQTARVSIERPAPAQVRNEAASETKQPSDSSNARSIECRFISENERTLELSVEAAFGSGTPDQPSGATPPLLRVRVHVTVELDRPTVISRIDDPDGNRSFTIELTATRIKDKS